MAGVINIPFGPKVYLSRAFLIKLHAAQVYGLKEPRKFLGEDLQK